MVRNIDLQRSVRRHISHARLTAGQGSDNCSNDGNADEAAAANKDIIVLAHEVAPPGMLLALALDRLGNKYCCKVGSLCFHVQPGEILAKVLRPVLESNGAKVSVMLPAASADTVDSLEDEAVFARLFAECGCVALVQVGVRVRGHPVTAIKLETLCTGQVSQDFVSFVDRLEEERSSMMLLDKGDNIWVVVVLMNVRPG
mmetsp:Transcript_62630/g.149432  ORF Transcript_62630/g.149432 Transcript_62630/m.149432 type:complete len:200 (+) Transcript_62630:790-1389(+)